MKIAVVETDWGQAWPSDIKALLENTASHLNRFLRVPFSGTIVIVPSPPGAIPRTHIRPNRRGPITIQLATRDTYWAQFAFQFSHEFCHVLSGYERLRTNPNNWFHEAVCELASIFTLRRMAETWPVHPPFPNWSNYAGSLADYAEERLSCEESKLPQGETLRSWLCEKADELYHSIVMTPCFPTYPRPWIPAFAGMTIRNL